MLELRSLPTDCAQRRQDSVCSTCGARAFSVCSSLDPADLAGLDSIAERVSLKAGESLIREGDPAVHLFNITSGSVRIYKLLPDGRRQITGFLFAGDFVGLATGQDYAFSGEAIEDATLCRFRKTDYRALIRERPLLEEALLDRATHELAAAQNQMLLLGRKTAQERIASFLLDLPTRDPLRPSTEDQVRLPMTRSEIADYLGLTIETVSRVLTKLKTTGVIRLLSLNELRIEQPERLRDIAEGEA
ncbi:MAG: helix-turn-helix domain-containing protein [Brevundimonas sp.]|uniref:helix-turn-helix domain-containing protein n=1 Tax=Brevundimonas sp. TaxID=1871086 RepID=UPI00272691E8|nr:helix-turn-helix domain-containing protein [Brevundimonas sp.]MDO9608004.1 helix-turn-helix domain-containing protein [Brevundimonas sp.]